jgi:hypothetical protein
MDWYYAQHDQRMGPVNEADLERLVKEGTITPDSLVWHEGMAQWTRYGEVSG